MAIVEFSMADLESLVGRNLSKKDLEETIPMMGCPLERMDDGRVWYEVFPDRPDMLSIEGFARAVRTFLGGPIPRYKVSPGKIVLKVSPSVKKVRPFIGAAVVKDVKLTSGAVESLMQVQEKLHETLGRKRRKVAIGIHDLDRVKSPFTYKAVPPKSVSFVPLDKTRKMNLKEIGQYHEKGRAYIHILEGSKLWPIITDTNGDVLSFPPIINGELTRVTGRTKNLFIDITGTNPLAVQQTLNIIVTSLADRGATIESVDVQNQPMPDLSPTTMKLSRDYVNKLLDLDLTYTEIAALLTKMGINFDKKNNTALIPAYRTDIMHEIDLVEDIAIAFGYEEFEPRIPKVPTIARRLGEEETAKILRDAMTGPGYQEIQSMVLTNEETQFTRMHVSGKSCKIANSVTAECTMCRTWILPSLMKVFAQNMHREYPQRIFELGECIIPDEKAETKTITLRKLAAALSANLATYEEISAVLSAFLKTLGVKFTLMPTQHGSFIKGRCASVLVAGKPIGFVGEVTPEVLTNWGLEKPAAAFELDTSFLKKRL